MEDNTNPGLEPIQPATPAPWTTGSANANTS